MEKSIAALLIALLAIMSLAAPVYAQDDDEDDEEEVNLASGENEENEDDEDRETVPGFGIALAIAGALAGARLIKSRIN